MFFFCFFLLLFFFSRCLCLIVGVQPEYLADTPPTSLAQTRPSCEASSRAVASAPHRKSLRSHLMSAPTSDSTSGNNAAGSNGGCSAEGGRTGDTVSKQPLPTRLALSSRYDDACFLVPILVPSVLSSYQEGEETIAFKKQLGWVAVHS